jgi:hypothetical protein
VLVLVLMLLVLLMVGLGLRSLELGLFEVKAIVATTTVMAKIDIITPTKSKRLLFILEINYLLPFSFFYSPEIEKGI